MYKYVACVSIMCHQCVSKREEKNCVNMLWNMSLRFMLLAVN